MVIFAVDKAGREMYINTKHIIRITIQANDFLVEFTNGNVQTFAFGQLERWLSETAKRY